MFWRGTYNKTYLYLGRTMQTLKLDSSYKPIGIIDSIDAFSLIYRGKAVMVESYNSSLNSGSRSFPEPAVIALTRFVDFRFFQVGCTRRNIYQRDKNTCQYCRQPFPLSKLTLDHVIPKSKGGGKSWNNLVASCMKCNQKKGNRLPNEAGMQLLKPPLKPRYRLLDYLGPVHDLWKPYLSGFKTN